MTKTLSQFLQSDELDVTMQLARSVKPLDEAGEEEVVAVIERWNEPQAIANLLMYPSILPAEVRQAALLRGLNEPLTYYTLAAIVGLQDHADWWSDNERATIVERLHYIIFGAPRVIAHRASLTMLDYARIQDVDRLVFSLGSPSEVVQYNTLVALVRLLGVEETRQRIDAQFEAKRVTAEGRDYAYAHLDALSENDLPLLSYIPNLKDFEV